jgi:hypothetical protein
MRSSLGAPHSTEHCKVTKKNVSMQTNAHVFHAFKSIKTSVEAKPLIGLTNPTCLTPSPLW